MATGLEKTCAVIALADLLMRAGWVKSVLFLADRIALVNQATNTFKAHLPDCAPVNLVTERRSDGRVFLSTYPTMMNLIDAGIGDAATTERAWEVGHGFGRFVRALVGLDRQAVSEALSEFVAPGTVTAAQIEFLGLVIEHLTHQGAMDPGPLCEPPFTDIVPTGPEQVFDEPRIGKLFSRIKELNESAVA